MFLALFFNSLASWDILNCEAVIGLYNLEWLFLWELLLLFFFKLQKTSLNWIVKKSGKKKSLIFCSSTQAENCLAAFTSLSHFKRKLVNYINQNPMKQVNMLLAYGVLVSFQIIFPGKIKTEEAEIDSQIGSYFKLFKYQGHWLETVKFKCPSQNIILHILPLE